MERSSRNSTLTFNDLWNSKFGGVVRVVWNNQIIFEDLDDGLHIDGNWDPVENVQEAIKSFINKYGNKIIYNFYCSIVEFHHTELYIEGEK